MPIRIFLAVCLLSAFALSSRAIHAADAIVRVLPPEGLEIPADVRSRLDARLDATKKRLEAVRDVALKPDVEVFTKAVELALLHREFYVEKDFAKADWALDEASSRLDSLDKGQSPWTKATGTVVEGYHSSIDQSAQPYGLVIPKDHDFSKACPLYVWLHGRGDKATDLHFLQERATRPGQITPPGAIVVHPFGRHCVGWKHAGEIDVLETVDSVKRRYKIDPDRIVLIGFSMGGAGAWHIGAHYTDHWVAVSPGAGFVDTARYQKLTPDRYGEWYIQKLWGLYDVPDYVRNLFNTRVIAYSGELDPQRAAAVLMEEAFKGEGRQLEHLIGPGVEHKYEPKTLEELLNRLQTVVRLTDPRESKYPNEVHLQTRTLRYPGQKWVTVDGLEEHWNDARIDAQRQGDVIKLKTQNISRATLRVPAAWVSATVVADGQDLGQGLAVPRSQRERSADAQTAEAQFVKVNGRWQWSAPGATGSTLFKRSGQQGPIDDAFLSSFTIVAPTGKSRNAAFQAWCDAELKHFQDRWRALMRAEPPVVKDIEVGTIPKSTRNLILWGDPDSNQVLREVVEGGRIPVKFDEGKWTLGGTMYNGNRFVPALVFPNPDLANRPGGYIVLNSGLTFREGHDRTNSQQNPKLPDWAIIDITQPPNAQSPGRIHDADFFDESWQLKRQPKGP
jgi:hypothetical protein